MDGYASWFREADRACFALCGISIRDLTDVDFHDLYDEGVSPEDAAEAALEAADFSSFVE